MDFGEKPESGCPWLKKLNLDKYVTNGFVKKKTTIKSIIVVRPNVKAKPRTPPTAGPAQTARPR